jgi:hypothetical protein
VQLNFPTKSFIMETNHKKIKSTFSTSLKDLKTIELAILEAIVSFNRPKGEGAMCVELRDISKAIEADKKAILMLSDYLKRFKTLYMLRFNFPKGNTKDWDKLIRIIGEEYLPKLMNNPTPDDVEQFACDTKEKGLSAKTRSNQYKKLTSFASKLAFTAKPYKFWIYDKTVKNSFLLKANASYADLFEKCEKHYAEFLINYDYASISAKPSASFYKILSSEKYKSEFEDFKKSVNKLGIDREDYIVDLLNRRAFDKFNMIEGGFKKERLLFNKTALALI